MADAAPVPAGPISVVVPAHNEAAVIGRLLSALVADARPGELEVIVVANGCTDGTARVAAGYGPSVTVLSTPVASKFRAMRLGDAHARSHPRLYVDADVVLGTADVRALARALNRPGVLAAAPQRRLPLADRPLTVRWYYDVWQRLPVVRDGLFGRGVIGVSAEGQHRLAELPDAIGDDLAASVAFDRDERLVVDDAQVVVHPPRTAADLIRRRVRTATGTAQLQALMPQVSQARTSRSDLLAMVRERPALLPKLAVFLTITVIARLRARRAVRTKDFSTWLRDESSRAV